MPPGMLDPLVLVLVLSTGAGASLRGCLGWAALQPDRKAARLHLLGTVAGSFLGAWGGYAYGEAAYGYQIVPKSPAVFTSVFAAAVASSDRKSNRFQLM